MSHNAGVAIKVISDSVSDVPPDIALQLDITLVPTVVTIQGESYLDDGKQITREDFYDMLPDLAQLPTTSACPLGLTRDMIAVKADQADHLILIAAPKHLSSIYNNFRLAADEVAPGRYTLIDSGQVTMGQGFQVIRAAEMAEAGASPEEIMAELDTIRAHTHIYAALHTLENLHKSGRVGWAAAIAGRLLQIKPMVELTQGDVNSLGNIRTFRRAVARLLEIGLQHGPLGRLAILHTNNLEGAEQLRQDMAPALPPEQTLIVNVSPSLGTHVGPKALGLALVVQS